MVRLVESHDKNNIDQLSLLDRRALEKSALVQKLLGQVKQVLPAHFGQPRFIQAPLGFRHVIRADCRNEGCRSRAVIYVVRDKSNPCLHFDNCTPDQLPQLIYDRLDVTGQMCCTECRAHCYPSQT